MFYQYQTFQRTFFTVSLCTMKNITLKPVSIVCLSWNYIEFKRGRHFWTLSLILLTLQLSSLLGNSWVSLKPLKNHTVCTYMRSPPYLRYGSRSVDSLLPSATTYLFLGLVEPTTTTYIPTNLLYPFHAISENKRCELKTSIIRPSD